MQESVAKYINYALDRAKQDELPSYLTKYTDNTKIELTDYQYFFVSVFVYLEDLNNILLFWDTGYGKTLACVYVMKHIRRVFPQWKIFLFIKTSLDIAPWRLTMDLFLTTKEKNDVYIIHYDSKEAEYMFNNILRGIDTKVNRILFIIDEVHHVISKTISKQNEERKFSSVFKRIVNISNSDYNKLICASATPIVNYMDEFHQLIRLLRPGIMDKGDCKIINNSLFNVKNLKEALYGICSYNRENEYSSLDNAPAINGIVEKKVYFHNLKMSVQQSTLYDLAEKYDTDKNSKLKHLRVMRRLVSSFAFQNLKKKGDLNESEFIKHIHKELAAFRVIANNIRFSNNFKNMLINGENITDSSEYIMYNTLYIYSCKYVKICELILKSKGKVLVYESFVNFEGITSLIEYLNCFGITFIEYSNRNLNSRNILLDKFNDVTNTYGNNIKVCVFSLAGNEGISFSSINDIIISDIPWTDASLRQIIGRSLRFNSHVLLPDDRQYVNVHILLAYTVTKKSIDVEILDIVKEKTKLIDTLSVLLKSVSIEKINSNFKLVEPENYYNDIFRKLRNEKIKKIEETTYVKIKTLTPIYYSLDKYCTNIYQGYLDKSTGYIYVNKVEIAKVNNNIGPVIHNNELIYIAELV